MKEIMQKIDHTRKGKIINTKENFYIYNTTQQINTGKNEKQR
jgi:hypothetical protein